MAKDLVRNCLQVSTATRYTADQILSHEWLIGENTPRENMPAVASKIRQFNARRRLKKHTNAVVAVNKWSKLVGLGSKA